MTRSFEIADLKRYVATTGTPTRRASEVFHNAPNIEDAYSALRFMRRDVQTVTSNSREYFNQRLTNLDIPAILTRYDADIQSYSRVENFDPIATGIPKERKGLIPEKVKLSEFARVDEEGSASETIAMVRKTFGKETIPHTISEMAESAIELLQLPANNSMDFVMGHITKLFPSIHAKAKRYISAGMNPVEASRLVFKEVRDEFEQDCRQIQGLTNQGLDSKEAKKIVLQHKYKDSESTEEINIKISKDDAKGLTQLYKAQRRPYSTTELKQAAELLRKDPKLLTSLVIFHELFTDYGRQYLEEHPERKGQTMKHFESVFLVYFDRRNQLKVSPNPRFISSMVNNWLGAIIRMQNKSRENIITSKSVADGINIAEDLGVFKMSVAKLNQDHHGKDILWGGNFQQVCPADKLITQMGSSFIPKIYDMLS